MNDSGIDFVLDGGCVPKNMKDLNIDGKTDEKDAELIQKYLIKDLTFDDYDNCHFFRISVASRISGVLSPLISQTKIAY